MRAAHSLTAAPLVRSQYMCLGLSVYDEARLRAAGAESRGSPTEPVEIPFCEGLEIVSAANVQQSPALLAADAGAGLNLIRTRTLTLTLPPIPTLP